uniref:Uncharacterized protein n=1 Tax=Anguilla anguilla TaxID=7936 RepID=A0A0E9UQL9_ANGAN
MHACAHIHKIHPHKHTVTQSHTQTHTHTSTRLKPSLTSALPVQFQLCPILTSVQLNPCT